MVITKEVFIKIGSINFQHYKKKYVNIIKGDVIKVSISDLLKNTKVKVLCKCDMCDFEKELYYSSYIETIGKNDNVYLCKKCSYNRTVKTNLERYGVSNVSQLESVKNKKIETSVKNYGLKHPSKSKIVKEKNIKTNNKKYGVDNPLQSEKIKKKIKTTNLEKYGVEYNTQNKDISNKLKKNIREAKNIKYNLLYKEYFQNTDYEFINYISNNIELKHKECGNIFNISIINFYNRKNRNNCLCTKCFPLYEQKSLKEKELENWLNSLGIDFKKSDRSVLSGKELDFYIENKKVAIEFNGLYYHSEMFKDKEYHLDKSLRCSMQDIHLLHIWEDEWVFKQDIVKSIIKNRLGIIDNKIYARQTEIKVVDDSRLVRKFLNDNHIQGYSQSSIKLGLYYKDELVSLMTFGYRHTNAKKEFELIRFCNRININVIGAASKLFNYFLKNYSFSELISYSDFRLFDGDMYKTLGFTKQHLSKPDYFWCKNLERKHRFNFNKRILIKDGFDPDKTENEIMWERGYYKIFGCGQYRWLYKNNI